MTDLTPSMPDAMQDTIPSLPDDLSHLIPAEDEALEAFIRDAGLFMNTSQLRLCLTQLQKAHEEASLAAIRLLDALCRVHTLRPEAQTLMGLDTDDPNHADALSALICRCRDADARRTTPPLQLRTVLDAIHHDISARMSAPVYDRDASLRFTLCDAATAAVLPTDGYAPRTTMYVASSALQLICHDPQQPKKHTHRQSTDRLCLVYAADEQSTDAHCRAACALFETAQQQHLLHTVQAIPQHLLLPAALACSGKGLTVDLSCLPTADQAGTPQPSDAVCKAPGGWLISVPTDRLEALQKLAAAFPLTIAPFALPRKDHLVEFSPLSGKKPVRIPLDLMRSMEFSFSYRLTDDRPGTNDQPPTSLPITPLLLRDEHADAYVQLADGQGCQSWYVRAVTLPLDDGYRPAAFSQAISTLQQVLTDDGCADLSDAALACGFEISPTLSRTTLWQNVLQMYHTLEERPMHLLPIALQHTEQEAAGSRCVLCMICHKPQPDPEAQPRPTSPALLTEQLPLPAECSLVHAEQPEVLVVHTAAFPPTGLAATLHDAGGNVRTLRLDRSEECSTILADAIHAARLVLFADADEQLERVLSHRRVQYALVSLVERDGLCLAQGASVCSLCRTGLYDEVLAELPNCAPIDAFASAFPLSVGYVRDLDRPDEAPLLRPLPDTLLLLREDIPVGDPMVELFRDPEATERNILAVTGTEDGRSAAVRLSAAGGHLIAFADGFTPGQLRRAVQYFR